MALLCVLYRVQNILSTTQLFDKMVSYAQNELNAGGLGYITIGDDGSAKGPIVKFLNEGQMKELIDLTSISAGDSVFLYVNLLERHLSYLEKLELN